MKTNNLKTKKLALSQKAKSKLKYTTYGAVILASLGVGGVSSQVLHDPASEVVSADTVNPVAHGKWGGADYTIDNGELTLSGGDIGTPYSALSGVIDASTITSIRIANPMSANDIDSALGGFPNLKSISGLGNLKYSGSAYAMFNGDSALTSLDLSNFDTSQITNMARMFYQDTALTNLDVSNFDTRNVTDMSYMFGNLSNVKILDVSHFDTRKVTAMTSMFANNYKLEQLDLSNFTMTPSAGWGYPMFDQDTALKRITLGKNVQFSQQLPYFPEITATDKYTGYWTNLGTPTNPADSNHWTSPELVANFDPATMGGDTYVWEEKGHEQGMWGSATFTNNNGALTLSGGNIGSPGTLSGALSLTGIDPSTITSINIANPMSANDIASAFSNFLNLKSITGLGNLSYSGTAARMFSGDSALTSIDLSNFDTSQITDMTSMFQDNSSLTSLDVSSFNTSNVTNTSYMFSGLSNLKSLDVSNFDTRNVTNTSYMFNGLSSLKSLDVSNFDTSNVTYMDSMFYGLTSLTSLNVSNLDASKVISKHYLFAYNSALEQLDLSNVTLPFNNLTSEPYGMFEGDTELKKLTLGKGVDLYQPSYLPAIPVTDKYTGYWTNLGTPTNPTGSNHWTSDELTANFAPATMGGDTYVWEEKGHEQGMWGGATFTLNNGDLTLSGGDIGNPYVNLVGALTTSGIDPSTVATIKIANPMSANGIASAFGNFPNLKTITGLGNLSYSGYAAYMFSGDNALTSLDFTNFDTSRITDMSFMFQNDSSLADLDVSGFNTSNVTNTSYMFSGLSSLKSLDVSNFDTSNVTYMDSMFYGLTSLTSLNVSNLDASKVISKHYLFAYNPALEQLDLSNVTLPFNNLTSEPYGMFEGDTELKKLTLGKGVDLYQFTYLPEIPATDKYTGYWTNLGTPTNPAGTNHWTSEELMTNFAPSTMGGDTYVWEEKSPAIQGNWGSANYSISNGALTLSSNSGTNIGTSDSLSKVLTNAGIDPSTITSINIQNEMSAKDISSAFAYLPNLKSVSGLGNLKYSGSAYAMFMNDTALTSIDFAGFDTSHITNMGRMFYGNRSLASVDTSAFNTAAVTDMNYMFSDTSLQNLNLSNFDTQNVTNMSGMFANSKALQALNLNSFNTQNVTNMYLMFMNTSALEKLDLTNFTITSGTTATSMFSGDKAIKELKFGANVHLSSAMGLPNISASGNYTGYWTNQAGSVKWTSSELLTNYDPATMAGDTYVWQTK